MTDPTARSTPSFTQSPSRLQAIYRGHQIAGSDHAVIVEEPGQGPVVYFPRDDVMMSVLNPIDFTTESSPHGTARYFTILRDGMFAERGAWTFEQPAPQSLELAGMIAFDPRYVTIEGAMERPDPLWAREQQQMSDYIRHTDSGAGVSQADHWAPTVSEPGDDLKG